MLKILLSIVALAALTGCQDITTKVLLGGTCIPSTGAQPIEDSIIVVSRSTIIAVGTRKDVPVPQDSERVNMQGKWIVHGGAGVVAPNQPADLAIYDSQPGPGATPSRRMTRGKWLP